MTRVNEHGQPVGTDLGDWEPPPPLPHVPLSGRHVTLEPYEWGSHGDDLWTVLSGEPSSIWTYMTMGPFSRPEEMRDALDAIGNDATRLPYSVLVGDTPVGFASYLRMEPGPGVIEVGSLVFSGSLQRTTAATETIFLMIDHAFTSGYRRVEWKCDSLNDPSRVAAERFGFTYEGTFRQATHYKGRNRDTAWYAIVDEDWTSLAAAFRRWLDPANFDADGSQKVSLRAMRGDSR